MFIPLDFITLHKFIDASKVFFSYKLHHLTDSYEFNVIPNAWCINRNIDKILLINLYKREHFVKDFFPIHIIYLIAKLWSRHFNIMPQQIWLWA